MGGGQAGAPADDDRGGRPLVTSPRGRRPLAGGDVPWSHPPGKATVTSLVTARAGPRGPVRIPEPERA
jgi:hypothetical protein